MAAKRKLVLKKSRFHTDNPTYLSAQMWEFKIKFAEGKGWYIHRYNGGRKPTELEGHWFNYDKAEQVLIRFLDRTDKNGMARWPNKKYIRHTHYTRMFLNGESPSK